MSKVAPLNSWFTWRYKILENVFVKCDFLNGRFRNRSSSQEVFLGGGVLNLYRKFIEHPYQRQCKKKITLAWVLSCKFASYFQNIFSKNTSEGLLLLCQYLEWMNYPLIQRIKIYFPLLHCYQILGISKTYYYVIYYILLQGRRH